VRCCDVRFLASIHFLSFHYCCLILFVISGTCLDFAVEARRVSERIVALEKA
jgi:hypothetical protein